MVSLEGGEVNCATKGVLDKVMFIMKNPEGGRSICGLFTCKVTQRATKESQIV